MALEEPANDAPLRPIARRRVEPLRHFVKRQVWRLLDPGHDQLAVRVDPVRARVAAALVRLEIAALPVARHPSDRRRDANPKTCRGRPTGPACINRIYDATAKIDREGFGHAGWPPSPALMMNHKITPNGIPNDSIAAQSALAQQLPKSNAQVLAMVREAALNEEYLVRAIDAPYDARMFLKARGYRWRPAELPNGKVWWTSTCDAAAEIDWLQSEVYGTVTSIPTSQITALNRYSERIWGDTN